MRSSLRRSATSARTCKENSSLRAACLEGAALCYEGRRQQMAVGPADRQCRQKIPGESPGIQLVKKGFDKLVDGEASSPARCRASNLRFEPSAVSPRAKPENPKGFQPPCHPHQSPLKIKDFSGAEPARKRFLLWKMRFSGAKIVPCPPYTPLGAIESSRGLRPSRALREFFDSLRLKTQMVFSLPAPSPVSAKNQRFFGRGDCRETIFSLENGIFRRKNRPVPTVHAAGHD